jgi:hypothetical protein
MERMDDDSVQMPARSNSITNVDYTAQGRKGGGVP